LGNLFLFFRGKTINREFQKQPINRSTKPRILTSLLPSETLIAHKIHLLEQIRKRNKSSEQIIKEYAIQIN